MSHYREIADAQFADLMERNARSYRASYSEDAVTVAQFGDGERFVPILTQPEIDRASSGPWKHKPTPRKRPGSIRFGVGLIVAILALWFLAGMTAKTARATFTPCPTEAC